MKYTLYILIIFLITACGKQAEKEKSTPTSTQGEGIAVQSIQATQESLQVPVIASGIITSNTDVKPGFKTGGIIAKTLVEEGDAVRKGQLLATLDLTEIGAQSRQANEGLSKAKRDLERAQNLYKDSVATLEQYQNAQTGVQVAEQTVSILDFNTQYSEVRSPIAGKVVKQIMHAGEIAGPGMPIYYIIGNNANDWVVRIGLADRDWARLNLGDRATVRLDAYPGRTFDATITQLADVANPQNGTFDVTLKINAQGTRLAAGLMAAVEISPKATAPQITLPIEALVETNRQSAIIFTIDNQNIAHKTMVTIGQIINEKVVITSGISVGTKVVTKGAAYLNDGDKIIQ